MAALNVARRCASKLPELLPRTLGSRNGPPIGDIPRSARALAQRFGLSSVQFAPTVRARERDAFITNAAHALCDLAKALGVGEGHIGLNATLGLSVGSARKGTWAHYDTAGRTIHVRARRSGGSVAHEWWHALDGQLGRRVRGARPARGTVTKQYGYIEMVFIKDEASNRATPSARGAPGAVARLVETLLKSTMCKRSAKLDRGRDEAYWSSAHELAARSFENQVIGRLRELGIRNDFLVARKNEREWRAEAKARWTEAYPYPNATEDAMLKARWDEIISLWKETLRTNANQPRRDDK